MNSSDGNTKNVNKGRRSGSVKCKCEMRVKNIMEDQGSEVSACLNRLLCKVKTAGTYTGVLISH